MAKRKSTKGRKKQDTKGKKRKITEIKPAGIKRPRGRPPKNTVWDGQTGQYVSFINFPKSIVKSANERLRKLEKVYGLYESSEIYQLMNKYKESYPNTKGKIYTSGQDGYGIRFIGKKDFDKLTDTEKEYYVNRLLKFMSANTSTLTGINEARYKAYTSFMASTNAQKKYKDLTFEEYQYFFEHYNTKLVPDSKTHYDYSDITKALSSIKINVAMREDQLDAIMQLIHSGKKSDWAKIDKKYKTKI